ncbi:MAG: prenyltransferase/squalene oxidase repeat-containing protein [Verrucomicrobiales bacterium]
MKKNHLKNRIEKIAFYAFAGTILAGEPALAAESQADAQGSRVIVTSNASLRHEVEQAMAKARDFLLSAQAPEGHWSTSDQPAVTALVLTALHAQPDKLSADSPALKKGYAFLKKCVQADGSVHNGKGLVNYNTSIALMAFMGNLKEFKGEAQKARAFLVSSQVDKGEVGTLDTPFDGGIGYGSKYEHSDMGNTLQALEALYYSKALIKNDSTRTPAKDLNWEAAIHFLQNCQNLPSHNKQDWASDDPANKGGFVYYPGHSMAGSTNLPNGKVALRSYGSISYGGLLSYIYAAMKKDDPRVVAVLEWLKNNYTLEENPGMGPQGLYYYYNTMSKALTLAGIPNLELNNGEKVNWREALALKLMNLQKADGSWANDNARWWEKDPALVTAYGIIALEMIRREL